MVSTSRDDTLRIWDGAKDLQALTVIKHYNNTGVQLPPEKPACYICARTGQKRLRVVINAVFRHV